MLKIVLVTGARPNFMKVAPIFAELSRHPDRCTPVLVHTGQHFDYNMSGVFIGQLGLPEPHHSLGIQSGPADQQLAEMLDKFDAIFATEKPDWVVVVGDVTSTLAGALAAKKRDIKVAHVEAGLRSFDTTMPEEHNRIATDCVSDLLFVSEPSGIRNLHDEGVAADKVFHVGNVMIDSLASITSPAEAPTTPPYCLATFHRPGNVDAPDNLHKLTRIVTAIAEKLPVVWPIHPRTRARLHEANLLSALDENPDITLLPPLDYLRFVQYQRDATAIVTDSGGIQEEATWLGVPCLTLRPNTERPATVRTGTNTLVRELSVEAVIKHINNILLHRYKRGRVPRLWDGQAALRVCDILLRFL